MRYPNPGRKGLLIGSILLICFLCRALFLSALNTGGIPPFNLKNKDLLSSQPSTVQTVKIAQSVPPQSPSSQSETLPKETRQKRTFYLCASPNSLPYSSRDLDLPGYELEIGKEVGKVLGINIRVEYLRAYRPRDYAECDFLMGVIQPEDEEENSRGRFFTSKPYYGTGNVLVIPKEAQGIKSIDDLDKNLKIGIEPGSWAHYILTHKKGFTVTPYVTQEDIIEAMTRKEIQAAVVTAAAVGWYLKQHPDAPIKVPEGYVPEPELRWNVVMGVNKINKDLEEAINAALTLLTQNGTIQSLMAKYGVPYYPPFPAIK
jgi:polar amino acid transport system substrate-binding protein